MSLLLPAVQKAREAAARIRCANNLRTLGLALHTYEVERGLYPTAGLSWDSAGNPVLDVPSTFTQLLPFIEKGDVFYQMDLSKPYNDPANRPAAKTAITTYLCPTNPVRARGGGDSLGYGMTDYAPTAAALLNPDTTAGTLVRLPSGGPTDFGPFRVPAAGIATVRDGPTQTIAFIEVVGRSEFFAGYKYTDPVGADLLPSGGTKRNSWRWAEPASALGVSGPPGATYPYMGKVINTFPLPFGGPPGCPWTAVGCGPNESPFSFHGRGVNAVFMDGHVSYIRDDMDVLTFRRLLTASEGLDVGTADY
jgi:prepilin-type processing-associated H-X9-DG protein